MMCHLSVNRLGIEQYKKKLLTQAIYHESNANTISTILKTTP